MRVYVKGITLNIIIKKCSGFTAAYLHKAKWHCSLELPKVLIQRKLQQKIEEISLQAATWIVWFPVDRFNLILELPGKKGEGKTDNTPNIYSIWI